MASGRIIQFNQARGYGFIEQDNGGDDVFIHLAELGDASAARLGTRLEFNVLRNDRGLKACDVKVVNGAAATSGPRAATAFAPTPTPPMPTPPALDDDSLVDVLSSGEYAREITDALIEVLPTITANEIVKIRQRLTEVAWRRGWLDE
jgi:cold shock CspA family protein